MQLHHMVCGTALLALVGCASTERRAVTAVDPSTDAALWTPPGSGDIAISDYTEKKAKPSPSPYVLHEPNRREMKSRLLVIR